MRALGLTVWLLCGIVLGCTLLSCTKGRQASESTDGPAAAAAAQRPSSGTASRATAAASSGGIDGSVEHGAASTVGAAERAPTSAEAEHAAAPGSGGLRLDPAEHELTWQLTMGRWRRVDVVVYVPAREDAEQRLPVLIAFHGRGETLKGPQRGARGWLDDYALGRAMDRIASPPLTRADFGEMITDERLAKINAQLERQPYRPMIVAMPYLPDMLGGETAFENAPELSEFVVDRLLPRLYSQTPALGTPASTGIDGVSLGGRAALLVGLSRPMAFGAVAGTQAAVDPAELGRFAAMARKAQQRNPALSLRLLTSTSDYYHDVLEDLHEHFAKAGVRSELLVVSGTHSYAFNRGPGSYEMLLHHSAVLHEARK